MVAVHPTERIDVNLMNMANVPYKGYDENLEDAKAAFAEESDMYIFSEAWHRGTRRAIYAAAPDYIRFGPRILRQSVLIAWDSRKAQKMSTASVGWILLHGIITFALSRTRRKLLSDARGMPFARLRLLRSKIPFILAGWHLAPSGTAQGAAAVKASQAAHETADRRVTRFCNRRPWILKVFGGDKNQTKRLAPGPGPTAPHDRIDGVEVQNGQEHRAKVIDIRYYKQPNGDHIINGKKMATVITLELYKVA